jgi:molybdopterin adenylyltransferase
MLVVRTGILHVPELDVVAGEAVVELMAASGLRPLVVLERSVLSQRNWIADLLCRWCDEEELDLVLTIGGTLAAPGPSAKEIVPEATSEVIERALPGLAEAMRAYAGEENMLALLERTQTGIRARTLIINLPAGAGPATLFLEGIVDVIGPVIGHLRGDTNAPSLRDELERASERQKNPERAHDSIGEEFVEDGSAGGQAEVPPTPSYGLSAADFAQFLERSKKNTAEDD